MKKYDVIGIGSPLLDFIAEVDDSLLKEMEFNKGQCNFVDDVKSKEILKRLGDVKIAPGCSSGNVAAGVAVLGGSAGYLGKIGKDEYGKVYEQKTKEIGVNTILPKHESVMTGSCITFITPDAERSFVVNLGAAQHLSKEDVIEEEVKQSKILHVLGFHLGDNVLKDAALHAMEIAKENGVKVSIDFSDAGLIRANLEEFRRIAKEYADIIFANEDEAEALTGKKEEEALHEIYDMCEIAIVKLGAEGSIIKAANMIYRIPAYKGKVVNTNGAGDAYAAGILYSIANNIDFEKAGHIASYAASLAVQQTGARLSQKHVQLLNKKNEKKK